MAQPTKSRRRSPLEVQVDALRERLLRLDSPLWNERHRIEERLAALERVVGHFSTGDHDPARGLCRAIVDATVRAGEALDQAKTLTDVVGHRRGECTVPAGLCRDVERLAEAVGQARTLDAFGRWVAPTGLLGDVLDLQDDIRRLQYRLNGRASRSRPWWPRLRAWWRGEAE